MPVVPFRGRSFHRQAPCPRVAAGERCTVNYCYHCDGGFFVCANCGAGEGAIATDCPRVLTTPEQDDEVYAGRLDFILAAGGWVRPESPRAYPSAGAAVMKCTAE